MTDVLAISEHWLYRYSLSLLDSLDGNFECFARSSVLNDLNFRWRRGQGGVEERIGGPTITRRK